MTFPTYISYGDEQAGTGNVTYTLPNNGTAWAAGDLLLLVIETANEAVTPPTGWTLLVEIGTGTAAATDATRLTVFYRVAQTGDTAPTVTDPGDHQCGHTMAIRCSGGVSIGNIASDVLTSSSTTVTCPTIATTGTDRLVVCIASSPLDTASWPGSTSWTNANLTSFGEGGTIYIGTQTSSGNGGAISGVTGRRANQTASIGSTTSTWSTAAARSARVTFELFQTPAALNANPSPAAAAAAAVTPTLTAGSVTAAPAPAAAAATGVIPQLINAGDPLPDPAVASATGVTPTLAAGGVTISPSPAAASATGVTPTMTSVSVDIGAHGKDVVLFAAESAGNATVTLTTQATGSMFLVVVFGNLNDFDTESPSDNKGNTYKQLIPTGGTAPGGASAGSREYTLYPGYGGACWVTGPNATGGSSHTFSKSFGNFDEMTMFVVEILRGKIVRAIKWNHPASGSAITSQSITTELSSFVVAATSGDAPVGQDHTLSANNGYDQLEFYGTDVSNGYIQAGLHGDVKDTAGTYSVTFTWTPTQGAMIFHLAFEGDLVLPVASSAATGVTPTLTAGAVSITASPAAAAAIGVAPDTTQAMSPAPASSSATGATPTLTAGAVTIAPSPAAAAATGADPALLGAGELGPAPALATATGVTPLLAAGTATAAPAPAAATATGVQPSLSAGVATSSPSPAVANGTGVAPTLTAGAAVVPDPAVAIATGATPTLSGTAQMTASPAAAAAIGVAPTFELGGQLSPAPAEAIAIGVAPTLAPGVASLSIAPAAAAAIGVTPTLTAPDQHHGTVNAGATIREARGGATVRRSRGGARIV